MGKAQRFERRLQGMVGDAFARVFGGSVVPQEVAQALQREAEDNARPLAGGRVLAPNRYTVTLGVADHDRLAGDKQRVTRMLQSCVQDHLAEQGWDVYGDVVVALELSATLHTGQFRTSSSVEPDTPHPRSAGDLSMSGTYQPSSGYQDYGHQDYGTYGAERPGRDHELDHDRVGDRQVSASLVLDDGSNRHYQLTEGTIVVGRGQDAEVRLPDTGVSRRHLEITWDGRSALLTDLGSTNGTTVNGNPVQTRRLVDGDVVRVGQSRLVFRTGG